MKAARVYRQAVNSDHEVLLFRATPGYKERAVYVERRSHLRAWAFARVSPLVLLSITRTADISNHFAGRQEAYHNGTPCISTLGGLFRTRFFLKHVSKRIYSPTTWPREIYGRENGDDISRGHDAILKFVST